MRINSDTDNGSKLAVTEKKREREKESINLACNKIFLSIKNNNVN